MYAFNMDTQSAMMVLPLCPGGDLFDFITRHRKDMRSGLVRRIFGEVCRAVAYLHSNFVVHRDIKLENVLLNLPVEQLLTLNESYQEYPKAIATLTDMGLSRTIDPAEPNLTTRCGSVDYVPPELLMGQPYDGRQTDSWALGVLLYAMMEGRLPFDPPVYSGRQVRGKVAHRIARVEWSWIVFKNHHDIDSDTMPNNQEKGTVPASSGNTLAANGAGENRFDERYGKWDGGMELVEGALQKRDKRLLAVDMVNHPWVKGSTPENLQSSWIDDISPIFK